MHSRFQHAFASLPAALQAALRDIINNSTFSAMLTAEQVHHLQQVVQGDADRLAQSLLPLAAACAQTPISAFHVGAIARGVSGNWYFGANMEFAHAAIQQTVHAEQSAIIHAWLHDEPALESLTVSHSPCGHCRQFMNELNCAATLRICLPQKPAARLATYLPDAFGPRDLAISSLLFDPSMQPFSMQGGPTEQRAIQAASRSYAPYSNAWSGVAIEMKDGQHVVGRYAENAAFNPSLPPLQAALILSHLRGYTPNDINRVVLAERNNAVITQQPTTAALLKAIGCQALSVVLL